MAEVIWGDSALDDLEAIVEYIALDKPDAAVRFAKRVFQRVEMLGKAPKLGPRMPELPRGARHRQIVVGPCRIFYRHDESAKKVFIVGVMRGEKLFQSRLLYERDL